MHLIWQTQTITNSTRTYLELTFQPSSESGCGFDLIQKEQLDEDEKISRQHRHIVDDNNITYTKIGNSDLVWEKAEDNNWYKGVNYTVEKS